MTSYDLVEESSLAQQFDSFKKEMTGQILVKLAGFIQMANNFLSINDKRAYKK